MNKDFVVPGGSSLPKTLDVNLALYVYNNYHDTNLGTDIYIFNGYSDLAFTSRTGNGASVTLTLYDKSGKQVAQYTNIYNGFTCKVEGVYRCNIRLSMSAPNKFLYGIAAFS